MSLWPCSIVISKEVFIGLLESLRTARRWRKWSSIRRCTATVRGGSGRCRCSLARWTGTGRSSTVSRKSASRRSSDVKVFVDGVDVVGSVDKVDVSAASLTQAEYVLIAMRKVIEAGKRYQDYGRE